MNVGAHVSSAGPLSAAVERQSAAGGTCGQLFTTAPVVWDEPTLTKEEETAFREASTVTGVDPWVIHAPYLVNIASPDPELWERSIERLQADLRLAKRIGATSVNVHLGAHTGSGVDAGIERASDAIDRLTVPDSVRLVVETDAGAGTKLGGDFDHFAALFDRVDTPLSVCFDTAHVHVSGYDLSTATGVAETFDRFDAKVGLDSLGLVHLNDPVHECGSRTDEHAHIGDGTIGSSGITEILTSVAPMSVPMILETPVDDDRGDAWNITRIRTLSENI